MRDEIEARRRQINNVDRELLRLLNERARLSAEVGELKRRDELPLYDPEREQEVISQLLKANRGPLSDSSVVRIFQSIIDEVRLLQARESHASPTEPDETIG